MGQWSELPVDLLKAIEERLVLYRDKVRLSSVSVSWRSALPKTPKLNHLPWLLLPYDDANQTTHGFFSILEKKIYHLDLHEARGKLFRGSSHGWVVAVDDSPAIYLFNPLTRVQVQLPPRSKFPDVRNYRADKLDNEYAIWKDKLDNEYSIRKANNRGFYTLSSTHVRTYFTEKVVLSSSPLCDYFTAVTIYGEFGRLAYCRRGDKKWTSIHGNQNCFSDVIFYKGQMYALTRSGSLMVCEIDPYPKVTEILPPHPAVNYSLLYLVESGDGLLMVERYVDSCSSNDPKRIYVYKTFKFNVFKLDPSGPRWCEVKDLGDNMLFLGLNSSVSISSHDFAGCKGNCIYFTDDNLCFHEEGIEGGFDVGVFNLDGEIIEPLPGYKGDPDLVWPTPVWVTPNPN